jgi:hypothetical protein
MEEVHNQLLVAVVYLLSRRSSGVEFQELAATNILRLVLENRFSYFVGKSFISNVLFIKLVDVCCIEVNHVESILPIDLNQHKKIIGVRNE